MTGQFGIFPDRETRDAWVALRDRRIAAEAAALARIGITGPDDLCAKYGQLCHLYETGELPEPGEFGLLTSDGYASSEYVGESPAGIAQYEPRHCSCRRYSGPVPMPEFYAPELSDGTP